MMVYRFRAPILVSVVASALISFTTLVVGQPADEQKVKDVIAQLFRGMELGDSALVHQCFASDPAMGTVRANKGGQMILSREGSLAGFLKAIGTAHEEKWHEEVWNMKVAIDGSFAQVWCDYAFYRGHTFSHCGVDAFHLFKDGDHWKIFNLADTRRADGCRIPNDIAKKHVP